MKFMDHLKDRIKYKTKTVVRVENGVTEHIKLKAKRLPRLLRKLRKLGKFALYAAIILLSIGIAFAIAYVISGSSSPPSE